MANKEILAFIRQCRESGVSDDEAGNRLREAGWDPADINAAFADLSGEKPVPAADISASPFRYMQEEERGRSKSKIRLLPILTTVVLCALIAISAYYLLAPYLEKMPPSEREKTPESNGIITTPQENGEPETSNGNGEIMSNGKKEAPNAWITYYNKTAGFKLEYPAVYSLTKLQDEAREAIEIANASMYRVKVSLLQKDRYDAIRQRRRETDVAEFYGYCFAEERETEINGLEAVAIHPCVKGAIPELSRPQDDIAEVIIFVGDRMLILENQGPANHLLHFKNFEHIYNSVAKLSEKERSDPEIKEEYRSADSAATPELKSLISSLGQIFSDGYFHYTDVTYNPYDGIYYMIRKENMYGRCGNDGTSMCDLVAKEEGGSLHILDNLLDCKGGAYLVDFTDEYTLIINFVETIDSEASVDRVEYDVRSNCAELFSPKT